MLRLTDIWIYKSCENSSGKWDIINIKVKVEINNVAFSKVLWLLEKMFWICYM